MPRPPPVTSARLPSRRNEGVVARSTIVSLKCASFAGAGEEEQIAVGVFDDEVAGAPGLFLQRLEKRNAFGLKLKEELLDLVVGVHAHVGGQQALAVAQ